ncbi:MAG: hypothetical protein ACTHK2_05620 [Dokdonella sp.]|uniref:hypothetical protein n=1 Tax=Dokdonella sp. TaxID=2291710 RepID=UPI003F7D561B
MRMLSKLAFAGALVSLAATARAISLDPHGIGQALIFPYYTTNKGQDTLISVANASDASRMALVRFNEGTNGRPVMDFALFLAPHDVWTARVSASEADGVASVYTSDHSCTYPAIGAGRAFDASAYAGGSIYPGDGGPTGAFRTREGFFEIYEVGTVMSGSPLDLEIRRQDGQVAPTCSAAQLIVLASEYLTPPDGRLSGSVAIVNVGEGTFFSYSPQALAGFTDQALCCYNEWVFYTGPRMTNSSDSTYPQGAVAHLPMGDRDVALDFSFGLDAFSAVFMADSVSNDYLVAAGLGAHTDWVLTFPTKAFHTDPFYVGDDPRAPFVEPFHSPGVSNVLANATQYDQEEGHGETSALTLPWVVNVIGFQDASHDVSGVLGSALTVPVAPFSEAGTMTLDLAHGGDESHTLTAPDGRMLHGLPATGFMVYNIINANAAPGKLANYGGVFPYRSSAFCTVPAIDPAFCQ